MFDFFNSLWLLNKFISILKIFLSYSIPFDWVSILCLYAEVSHPVSSAPVEIGESLWQVTLEYNQFI